MTQNYTYEYENICYNKCPSNIFPDENNICQKVTTLPTDLITDPEGEITGINTINPIITTSINNIDSNISCPISNFFKND